MKNELSPLIYKMLGVPHKKWYEQEERREVFIPLPLPVVRSQMINALSSGTMDEKSFWSPTTDCTGNVTGNFLDMTITISTGKGSLSYYVFGELTGYSNGCLIQVAIRDINTGSGWLMIAAFIAFMSLEESMVFVIFRTLFFGVFGLLAATLQHYLGVRAVTKAIRNIAVQQVSNNRKH